MKSYCQLLLSSTANRVCGIPVKNHLHIWVLKYQKNTKDVDDNLTSILRISIPGLINTCLSTLKQRRKEVLI